MAFAEYTYPINDVAFRFIHNSDNKTILFQKMPEYITYASIATDTVHYGTETMEDFATRLKAEANSALVAYFDSLEEVPTDDVVESIAAQIDELISTFSVEDGKFV